MGNDTEVLLDGVVGEVCSPLLFYFLIGLLTLSIFHGKNDVGSRGRAKWNSQFSFRELTLVLVADSPIDASYNKISETKFEISHNEHFELEHIA